MNQCVKENLPLASCDSKEKKSRLKTANVLALPLVPLRQQQELSSLTRLLFLLARQQNARLMHKHSELEAYKNNDHRQLSGESLFLESHKQQQQTLASFPPSFLQSHPPPPPHLVGAQLRAITARPKPAAHSLLMEAASGGIQQRQRHSIRQLWDL